MPLSDSRYVAATALGNKKIPRTADPFRELFSLSREFSAIGTVPELFERLADEVTAKYAPEALWVVGFCVLLRRELVLRGAWNSRLAPPEQDQWQQTLAELGRSIVVDRLAGIAA